MIPSLRRLIFATAALCLGMSLLFSQQTPSSGLAETISELRQDIADLEAELKVATDPSYIAELKQQIDQLNQTLEMISSVTSAMSQPMMAGNMNNMPMNDPSAEDPFYIPPRDGARIAKLPSGVLSDTDFGAFVRETEAAVRNHLPREISTQAERLSTEYAELVSTAELEGYLASGCWMMGQPEYALYFMGKACVADLTDANNLNNYAALLTMYGAEQKAIPILEKLNDAFPGNSSVLNNLGQAWLGLGDIDRAEDYFDSATKIVEKHSQSMMSLAAINMKRGNRRAAQACLQNSIEDGYSPEKELLLEDLGIPPEMINVEWVSIKEEKYLGLEKFLEQIPRYYYKAEEAGIAEKEWDAFRAMIQVEIEKLEVQRNELESRRMKEWTSMFSEMASGRKRISPYVTKYTQYMKQRRLPELFQENYFRRMEQGMEIAQRIGPLYSEIIRIKNDPHRSPGELCAAITRLMTTGNQLWGEFQSEDRLSGILREYEDEAEMHLYWNTPGEADYQVDILNLKIRFLHMLKDLSHIHPSNDCYKPPPGFKPGRLSVFEDTHCQRNIELWMAIGTIKLNCHYLTTSWGLPLGGLEIKGTTQEDMITGEFVKGTVDIAYSVGLGKTPGTSGSRGGGDFKVMPVAAEVKAYAGMSIEFDSEGITDVALKVGGKAKVGSNVTEGGTNPTTGAETNTKMPGNPSGTIASGEYRMGFNAGNSFSGKHFLSGLK